MPAHRSHAAARPKRIVVRIVTSLVCAAVFCGAPMSIALANKRAPQPASAVQYGPPYHPPVPALDGAGEAKFIRTNVVLRTRAARHADALRRARALRAAFLAKLEAFRNDHRCPVDHPRLFSDDYGDPRRGKHVHLGNDVVAPFGTPVRAPIDGVVTHGTDPRGGTILKLWGNGGHFYMAHLSGYGKSGRVVHGDIIGYVGDSGEARHGPPHDHIEWHPGNGPAVDPYSILMSLCAPRTTQDVVVGLRLMGLPRHPALARKGSR